MTRLANPEIKALVAAYSKLLVSNDWHPTRQLAALGALDNLAARASAIGAAGASVSHDRLAETGMLELCIGIVAAVDPKLALALPDLDPAEAMQTQILRALEALKQKDAA